MPEKAPSRRLLSHFTSTAKKKKEKKKENEAEFPIWGGKNNFLSKIMSG